MTREEAKATIKTNVLCTDFLDKDPHGGSMYICPFCDSGKKDNKTGAVKYYDDTNKIYCHACKKSADVIALYQQVKGVDYNHAIEELADLAGVVIDRAARRSDPEDVPPAAFDAYFKLCSNRLLDPDAERYLERRGISVETAAVYGIGYDPAADPANAPAALESGGKRFPCKRIIIPTSGGHYTGRSIENNTKFRYAEAKGKAKGVFNLNALHDPENKTVFVLEGAFDALSCLEVGAAAIATNGAGSISALISDLETNGTAATLILCADNDKNADTRKTITEHQQRLIDALERLNILYTVANVSGEYKDANDALTANRRAFEDSIARAQAAAGTKPDSVKEYIETLFYEDLAKFQTEVKTGFDNLDRKAGGLYPGVYVLAAASSLGKTTLALQMADQIAEGGRDVLYFSMEQSRLELVSKSLSRTMMKLHQNGELTQGEALTSLEIRRSHEKASLDIAIAADAYLEKVGDRMNIIEGNFACDIDYIGTYIENHIKKNDSKPVVFLDYLQIIQPGADQARATTKEVMDAAITELKRISRRHDITIIAISSINRANYLTPIDFESIKETGGIEYTCDVVWGLQLQCLETEEVFSNPKATITAKREKIKEEKARNPRKVELVCLKNRYGISSYSCDYEYYTEYDYFQEDNNRDEYNRRKKAELLKATH